MACKAKGKAKKMATGGPVDFSQYADQLTEEQLVEFGSLDDAGKTDYLSKLGLLKNVDPTMIQKLAGLGGKGAPGMTSPLSIGSTLAFKGIDAAIDPTKDDGTASIGKTGVQGFARGAGAVSPLLLSPAMLSNPVTATIGVAGTAVAGVGKGVYDMVKAGKENEKVLRKNKYDSLHSYLQNNPDAMAEGGKVKGKGGTDKVNMKLEPNDFVIPSETANTPLVKGLLKQLGIDGYAPSNGNTPVKVTGGTNPEVIIPKEKLSLAEKLLNQSNLTLMDLAPNAKPGNKMKDGGIVYDSKTNSYKSTKEIKDKNGKVIPAGSTYSINSGIWTGPDNKQLSKIELSKEYGTIFQEAKKAGIVDPMTQGTGSGKSTYVWPEETLAAKKLREEKESKLKEETPFESLQKQSKEVDLSGYQVKDPKLVENENFLKSIGETVPDENITLDPTTGIGKEWADSTQKQLADNIANKGTKEAATKEGEESSAFGMQDAFALGQIGLGMTKMFTNGPRPEYETPGVLTDMYRSARADANYGFSAIQMNELEKSIASNEAELDYMSKSGSPQQSFLQKVRAARASNTAHTNIQMQDEELKLKKKQYADTLGTRIADSEKYKYATEADAFQREEDSAAALIDAGLHNLFGSAELRKQQDFNKNLLKNYSSSTFNFGQ